MRNESPEKNSVISWIILGIGALLAVIGAMTTQEYRVNLLLIIGGLIVLCGIAYHLIMVRCPCCGHSLAGYRPIPKECPKCHKQFEQVSSNMSNRQNQPPAVMPAAVLLSIIGSGGGRQMPDPAVCCRKPWNKGLKKSGCCAYASSAAGGWD